MAEHPPGSPSTAFAEPLILSASRATDIPAFHMPWFMERLRAGFCVRINPFNPRQRIRLSFARCRMLVFWSKDPRPLLPHLPEIMERGFSFYLHYTLNDYEREGLEPRVPPLAVRLETLRRLAETYGRDRIIWRADPLLLHADLPVPALLERLRCLGEHISPHTDKLVFSFLDVYAKIRNRLRTFPLTPRAPDEQEMFELASGIAHIARTWSHPLQLAACAEPHDFTPWGITKNACIDLNRIRRLCPEDMELAELTGKKDSGQRPDCACAPSRDVGAYNTCMHLCAYCYANQSSQTVIKTLNRHNPDAEVLG